MLRLNHAQAKGLANFFFDVAKGALLAGLGFSVVTPTSLSLRLLSLINSILVTYFSIRLALEFLREAND